MARWVAVELAKGKALGGARVVSEANFLERTHPMAKVDETSWYGLGLVVEKYHGVDVIWHTGGTLGFNTIALWLPEHDVGLVVLTNANGAGALLGAARRRFLELLFDAKDEAAENFEASLVRRDERTARELKSLDRAPGMEWVGGLAGTYREAALGTVKVRWDGTRGLLETPDWKSAIGRIKELDGGDRVVLLDAPWGGFEFLVKRTGDDVTLVLEEGQEKYSFSRRP
jgi:hypothetical protein